MGTWSHEPFGNDRACDWSYSLVETKDLSVVESAIEAVLSRGTAYLDADTASEAIAAIEVMAKLIGRGTQFDTYTEDVDAWVAANPLIPSDILLQKARAALERIRSVDSELRELWEEGDDVLWKTTLAQLQTAVSA